MRKLLLGVCLGIFISGNAQQPDTVQVQKYLEAAVDFQGIQEFANSQLFVEEIKKILKPHFSDSSRLMLYTRDVEALNIYHLESYTKARQIWEENLRIRQHLLRPDHSDIARSHHLLGTNDIYTGDLASAIPRLELALEIYAGQSDFEKMELIPPNLNLATVYEMVGELEKAYLHYQKAYEYFQEEENLTLDIHMRVLVGLGKVLVKMGRIEEGKAYFEQTLQVIDEDPENYAGTKQFSKRLTLNEMAQAAGNAELYDDALSYFYQVRSLLPQEKSMGIIIETANTYNNIGYIHLLKKEYQDAVKNLEEALEYLEMAGMSQHQEYARFLSNLGLGYHGIGQYNKALETYEASFQVMGVNPSDLESILERHSPEIILHTLARMSKSYTVRYEKEGKAEDFTLADTISAAGLDYLRFLSSKLLGDSPKQEMIATHHRLYDVAIQLALQKENGLKDAFALQASSKHIQLKLAMQGKNVTAYRGVPAEILEKEKELKKLETYWLQRMLYAVDTAMASYQEALVKVSQELNEFQQKIKEEYPAYFQVKYGIENLDITELQTQLKKDESVVSYYLGEEQNWAFVVSSSDFDVIPLASFSGLGERIGAFREAIEAPQSLAYGTQTEREAADKEYRELAFEFYEGFWKPVEHLLKEKVRVVPDGPLAYLPFDALLTSKASLETPFDELPYLIQKHLIHYAYEMGSTKYQAKRSGGSPNLLLILPNVKENNLQVATDKMKGISEYFPAKILDGASASKADFLTLSPDYRLIHFAGHAGTNPQNGETWIELSQEGEAANRLLGREIYNLDLSANLVALSACETGLGAYKKGEGVLSLAHAFSFAGAQSLLQTNWKVENKGSSLLMEAFYQALGERKDKASALRQAKFVLMERSDMHHPYYWSGFNLIGDISPLPRKRSAFAWGIGIGFIVLLGLFWGKRKI